MGLLLGMARSAHLGAAEHSFTPDGWHYSSFSNGSNPFFAYKVITEKSYDN
jgi:hypothetical protein